MGVCVQDEGDEREDDKPAPKKPDVYRSSQKDVVAGAAPEAVRGGGRLGGRMLSH